MRFAALSPELVAAYVATNEPLYGPPRRDAHAELLRLTQSKAHVPARYAAQQRQGRRVRGISATSMRNGAGGLTCDPLARREWRSARSSYGIQGLAGMFVDRIEGCYYNVVGFPIHAVSSMLVDVLPDAARVQ